MFLHLILAVPLVFAKPDIVVKWLLPDSNSISIQVTGQDPILESCLASGSVLRYVYQAQICKRRPAWFDNCQEIRQLTRTVQYDPIARTYTVSSSWDEAGNETEQQVFSEKSEMLDHLRSYSRLELSFLAYELSEYVHSLRSYVGLRVTSECQGQYNRTLAAISKVLSFGLARIHGFDTGWIDFKLRNNP